ncbi:MAG: sodium:calcium antiporter, partial [Cyanobacteria bacterium REEB65]|nr:sodium:calcium antiporter [Cyanobacteria bacterium REEB65]
SILVDAIALLAWIAVIGIACEAFTNGIEWLGHRIGVHQGAIGSLLAAVGTALPETLVPIVAVLGVRNGDLAARRAIGEGAIVGAPFMLVTLALFLSGVAVVLFTRRGWRDEYLDVDTTNLRGDLIFFWLAYAAAVGAAFLPSWRISGWLTLKQALGFAFVAAYVGYVVRTLEAPGLAAQEMEPLYFARAHSRPPTWRIMAQVVLGLVGIAAGTEFFVGRIEHLALAARVPPLVLSLLITPFATELPEKYNSITWLRAKKDTLALGNVTGAMVFQSTVLVAIGLWLTPWRLSLPSLQAAIAGLASGLLLIWQVRPHSRLSAMTLLATGAFYAAFVVLVCLQR